MAKVTVRTSISCEPIVVDTERLTATQLDLQTAKERVTPLRKVQGTVVVLGQLGHLGDPGNPALLLTTGLDGPGVIHITRDSARRVREAEGFENPADY